MNMELLEKVAQWLEAGAPHEVTGGMGFDMETYGATVNYEYQDWVREWNNPACGTVGCIAGAINQFAGNNTNGWRGPWDAVEALGVSDGGLRHKLFILFQPNDISDDDSEYDPDFDYDSAWDASPQQAAKVVRHFMTTGEVDWKKAFE